MLSSMRRRFTDNMDSPLTCMGCWGIVEFSRGTKGCNAKHTLYSNP